MRDAIATWVLRYVQAWTSNAPSDIGALFSDEAHYFQAPYGTPWEGRDAIVAGWLDIADEPGTWDFRFEVLGVDGNLGFVQGWTRYREGKNYLNLWVIRLTDAGECTEFTEWFMVDKSAPPPPKVE
jgi:ketosteroid isomerase-like protein